MKKEIRKVSEDGKIMQVTVADTERWYLEEDEKGKVTAYPSITWIASCYPKGTEFYKWLANKGWDESQAIVAAAGVRGHKVHQMITELLNGRTIKMEDKVLNPDTGEQEFIELDEYEALLSFAEWFKEVKPEPIQNEVAVINREVGFAGTVDFVCKINGELWIIDFKTSQYIWPSYEIQVAAYAHTEITQGQPCKLAILQLGYKRNKKRYKFTPVTDQYDLFAAAHQIWKKENPNSKPFVADYPTTISLGVAVQKAK
jgi:hypothetical protein